MKIGAKTLRNNFGMKATADEMDVTTFNNVTRLINNESMMLFHTVDIWLNATSCN